jgi:hypothetical protein
MDTLRELTDDEVAMVCGVGGSVAFNTISISGGYEVSASCGSGYSISWSNNSVNPNTVDNNSVLSNANNYSCYAGEGGYQSFYWDTDGAGSANFAWTYWSGS